MAETDGATCLLHGAAGCCCLRCAFDTQGRRRRWPGGEEEEVRPLIFIQQFASAYLLTYFAQVGNKTSAVRDPKLCPTVTVRLKGDVESLVSLREELQ